MSEPQSTATIREEIETVAAMIDALGGVLDAVAANACARQLAALSDELCAHADAITGLPHAAAWADLVVAVGELRDRLRRHVAGVRFATLDQIHAGLARLRQIDTVADLLVAAAQEAGECCGFDRVSVCRVADSSWREEAAWHRRGEGRPIEGWQPVEPGTPEVDMLRRHISLLAPAQFDRCDSYVAAPVVSGGRVVGFLRAGRADSGRRLTTMDRDNIASFADGFGLVFERAAVLERLRRQRERAAGAFEVVQRHLSGLDDTETVLIRGDRGSVAVVRMAAGLRKTATSVIDQLLSTRELQVLELMARGASNRQIADQLVIGEATVKSHARNISRKLRASSRADAVSAYLHLRAAS